MRRAGKGTAKQQGSRNIEGAPHTCIYIPARLHGSPPHHRDHSKKTENQRECNIDLVTGVLINRPLRLSSVIIGRDDLCTHGFTYLQL